MTSAYYCKISNELRVYNRDDSKAHNVVKTSTDNKKILKRLGFRWDKYNHSYVLTNPTQDAIEEIQKNVNVKMC